MDRPVLIGEVRTSRGVSPYKVWDGKRWRRCWSPMGAVLLVHELKREGKIAWPHSKREKHAHNAMGS